MSALTGPHANGRVPADTLAHRLQLIRDELGWSQRRAAEKCSISFGEWQSMESGARARGLDDKIRKIASATGYDPIWLMWGGPLAQPDPSAPRGRRRDEDGQPTATKVAADLVGRRRKRPVARRSLLGLLTGPRAA